MDACEVKTPTAPHGIVVYRSSNFKRLKAGIEIVPDSPLVLLTGKNGAGKSSVLESIMAALGGGRSTIDAPVRKGAKKASVELDLGDMTVSLNITAGGTRELTIIGKDGRLFSNPQKVLDAMISKVSLDPLSFMRATPAERTAMLLQLGNIGPDLELIDSQIAGLKLQRRDANAAHKQTTAVLDGMPVVQNAPAAPPDTASLSQELQALTTKISRCEMAQQRLTDLQATVARLQSELADAQDALAAAQQDYTGISDADLAEVDSLKAQIANSQDATRLYHEAQKYATAKAAWDKTAADVFDVECKLDKLTEARQAKIAALELPYPGLEIVDGEVHYNKLPLSSASQSEQLRVSIALALAMNPTLPVVFIKDGSLLDSAGRQIVLEMAAERGAQVWMEAVDESGKIGIVIEDGAIAEPIIDMGEV